MIIYKVSEKDGFDVMKDLSMHVLDIVENSIVAQSPWVGIDIAEDTMLNLLRMTISDKGCGMSKEMVEQVMDPFTTTRTTRTVGLGIPFLSQTCTQCGGKLVIKSQVGQGTTLTATMAHNHIDRPPLGDIASTIHALIIMHPTVDFTYTHHYNNQTFSLDTVEVKAVLEDVPLTSPSVVGWLLETLQDGIQEITTDQG